MLKLTETGNFTVVYDRAGHIYTPLAERVYPVGVFDDVSLAVREDDLPPDFYASHVGYPVDEWEALLDDMATWYFCADHDFYHGIHYECTHNVEAPEPRYDWKGEPR